MQSNTSSEGEGSGRGRAGVPSLAVWFAEWVMAVSRAICTGAKAPVTFARGRAAIKETGGSGQDSTADSLSEAAAIKPRTSHARSPTTLQQGREELHPSVLLISQYLRIRLVYTPLG